MRLAEAPDVLDVAQLADVLDLSERTIYTLLRSGQLPGMKIRGSWRIPKVRLEAFLAGGTDDGHDNAEELSWAT